MRLAPVSLFFYRTPRHVVRWAGESARLTHGDRKAVDACRYYAALIVAAVQQVSREDLLNEKFYETHRHWFSPADLHPEILRVARIRSLVVMTMVSEAALWAFWSTSTFKEGALASVNLGDDTDTTAAIYGQLAGAVYGSQRLPPAWIHKLYASDLFRCVSKWIHYEGHQLHSSRSNDEQSASLTFSQQAANPSRTLPFPSVAKRLIQSFESLHPALYSSRIAINILRDHRIQLDMALTNLAHEHDPILSPPPPYSVTQSVDRSGAMARSSSRDAHGANERRKVFK